MRQKPYTDRAAFIVAQNISRTGFRMKCPLCKELMRYYMTRCKHPWDDISQKKEKICFNCATGGVFRQKKREALG